MTPGAAVAAILEPEQAICLAGLFLACGEQTTWVSQAAQRGALAAISCLGALRLGIGAGGLPGARSGACTAAHSQAEGSSVELREGQAGVAAKRGG
jgi:hypothetical protein